MKILVKKLHKDAIIPSYAHPGDAGMDLYSLEKCNLAPGESHAFSTGISIEIPPGYFASIRDKSGLAHKYDIHSLGGVIDAGYRGEYIIKLINLGKKSYKIEKGDKIAQMIVQPCARAEVEIVKKLSDTSRGIDGFGSTGKK